MLQVERSAGLVVPDADKGRINEAWRILKILNDRWDDLLLEHMTAQLGVKRSVLAGVPDTSANLLKSAIEQTCSFFDEEPLEQRGDPTLIRLMEEGGWWTVAGEHERNVRACRESDVFVGWDKDRDLPYYRLVTPDSMTVEPAPANPTRIGVVWEASRRTVPGSRGGEKAWFWDRWTPGGFSIWSNDRRRDVTAQFQDPENLGKAGKLEDEAGRPILRFAHFHSAGGGARFWHGFRNNEISFGTLQVGLLWTAAVHGMLRASWDQRVLLNGKIKGGTVETVGRSAIRTITPDATRIFEVDGENAAIDAWGASIDIEKAERFCRLYEARLGVAVGMSPADVIIESLNPASGASLVVSQTGKRRLAKRDAPHFRKGMRDIAEITAAVARANGVKCSAKDYSARFPGVELTIDERAKVSIYVVNELNAKLLDDVAAYQELHPGTSRGDAELDIDKFVVRRAEVAGLEEAKKIVGVDLVTPPARQVEETPADGNGAETPAA